MRHLAAVAWVVVLTGCSAPVDVPAPDVSWQPSYALATTPVEPFEQAGFNMVGYQGVLVGFYASNEDGMPRHAIRDGDALYTSQFLLGWTRYDAVSDLPGARAYRYYAWDPVHLVEQAGALEGTFTFRGREHAFVVTPGAQVRVDGDFDAETPYTLTPDSEFPFSIARPEALATADVEQGDGQARQRHAQVITWIADYAATNGRVPPEVNADALVLQRLGAPWPSSPYDGRPLLDERSSGHFEWSRCSDADATYVGYGWDGVPISRSFGRGCTAAF